MVKLKKYRMFIILVVVEVLTFLFLKSLPLENYILRCSVGLFILSIILNSGILKSFGNIRYSSQRESRRIDKKVDKMIDNVNYNNNNKEYKKENKKISFDLFILGLINLSFYIIIRIF